jgi:hypothetical protein
LGLGKDTFVVRETTIGNAQESPGTGFDANNDVCVAPGLVGAGFGVEEHEEAVEVDEEKDVEAEVEDLDLSDNGGERVLIALHLLGRGCGG